MSDELVHRKPLKGIVKWTGSKRWCANFIADFWRANQVKYFVEPFAGAMAATLASRPENAIINDINPHLINFYQQIQSGMVVTLDMQYDEDLYYKYRVQFNKLIEEGKGNTKEAAELFFYLNKTGFNGLCRFNRKGFFNVPFGSFKSVNYQLDTEILKGVFSEFNFNVGDFEELGSEQFGKDAFHFIDSPYDETFSDYSQEGFDWSDHVRLIEWASKLEGPVLLTNKATDRVLELLNEHGFNYKLVAKKHTIAASGDARKAMFEVFAWKNAELPENYPIDENWRDIMRGTKSKTTIKK